MDEFDNNVEDGFYAGDAVLEKLYSLKEFSTKEELEISLQALTEIDHRLAYFSEKLASLHISCLRRQWHLIYCLAFWIPRHLTEVFFTMDEKLQDFKESAKQVQQQLSELKIQAPQLQKSLTAFQDENWNMEKALCLSENGQLVNMKVKSNDQMAKQRRYILRMLEKSLARELDLEKKLADSRNNEELKMKLRYTEQVAFYMEETAEVVWGRFLEADNATEVLMGISKGIMGRLQVTEFNLNSSIQRENELKSKVQSLIEELKVNDVALENHERCSANVIVDNVQENSEVMALKEKVKVLEEGRKGYEVQINSLTEENEQLHEQFIEIESFAESLKESVDIAENRAENAEEKVTQLTETNIELTEELDFLKGSASTAEKKVGLLEKQVRELDIQVQNAKASSEASQEQQNMLYKAIWDMEILIEDLNSKVSEAESNKDSAEERCIVLSETNIELHEELDVLKSRMVSLKTSLDQASNTKLSSIKEVDTRTKMIMDMVIQLAAERERINKQLDCLKQENRSLVGKLKETRIGACINGIEDHLNKTFQVGEQSEIGNSETRATSSVSANKLAVFILLISVLGFCLLDENMFSFLKGLYSQVVT
ncbi:unnamed protein product [Vicia faba]|uniref:WIT1/2 N-terminal helical bundle domain-containing protein n=1 Tax=Vicia faba TaxID=3906 RepID=A0AAV0ZEA6_VICFA|nr:unnamed protein product [Vicia faba]